MEKYWENILFFHGQYKEVLMDKTERRQYRNAAKNALARAAYNPKKLVLI